ncbi:MAG: adenylyl-sulfate kinase [Pseudomonadota bacterium]|nr:adenylyl-sulfate kinase [Pseudomonadota bacterium]
MTSTPIRPGFILWLMGPTSSGKTTVSNALAAVLRDAGTPVIHFDGDEIRDFFGDNLGFKPEDRLRVVSTLIHLADKVSKAGTNVIVSALTANPDARKLLDERLGEAAIGFIQCSIDTCAARDPKGLHAKTKSGEIDTLVGYNTEYPTLDNPDIILDTENDPLDALVGQTVEFLRASGGLPEGS